MLNQTNTLLREDFAGSQINLDLLSYQKNPRVIPSSLRQLDWRESNFYISKLKGHTLITLATKGT